MELYDAISRLGEYSSESNLALNESKTKLMDACLYSPEVSSSRATGSLSTHKLQWEATTTRH